MRWLRNHILMPLGDDAHDRVARVQAGDLLCSVLTVPAGRVELVVIANLAWQDNIGMTGEIGLSFVL